MGIDAHLEGSWSWLVEICAEALPAGVWHAKLDEVCIPTHCARVDVALVELLTSRTCVIAQRCIRRSAHTFTQHMAPG